MGGAMIAARLNDARAERVVATAEVVGGQVVDQRWDGRLQQGLPEREHRRAGGDEHGGAEGAGHQAGRAEQQPGARPHQAHHGDHAGAAPALDPLQHHELEQHDHQRVAANANPSPRVEISPTARANAGMPVLSCA